MFEPSVRSSRRCRFVLATVLLAVVLSAVPALGEARNVVLMISDGAGFNAFHCASYYQHGDLGRQVYDAFPVRLAYTTFMLGKGGKPQGYDPNRTWSDFNAVKAGKAYEAFTDSAAAATALYTGRKTT